MTEKHTAQGYGYCGSSQKNNASKRHCQNSFLFYYHDSSPKYYLIKYIDVVDYLEVYFLESLMDADGYVAKSLLEYCI